MNWIELTTEEQFEQIWKNSEQDAQYIFKHSTRCGISRMALKKLENSIASLDQNVYIIDLLQFRNISNLVALKCNVVHQSPQLIVVKNRAVIYNNSHDAIEFKSF